MVNPIDDEIWTQATPEERILLRDAWIASRPKPPPRTLEQTAEDYVSIAAVELSPNRTSVFSEEEIVRMVFEELVPDPEMTVDLLIAAIRRDKTLHRIGDRYSIYTPSDLGED